MRAVVVDTGAWIALLNRRDPLHPSASAHLDRLRSDGARLVTTNYVIDETATRLRYGAGLAAAVRFKEVVDAARKSAALRVAWIDPRIEARAWAVLEEYADIGLGLTDATTAAVARAHRIREVFGFDADFRALGFLVAPLAG
ncbi:MAG: type II toxin-antitoxin system VapC family toxin [Candidatus Limnocylindria bacterium]